MSNPSTVTYEKFFKAKSEHEDLIKEIAKLHYSQEGLKELISINNNPSAIDTITDKYTKAYSECESLKNELKNIMVGDNVYISSYEISFNRLGVTFRFQKYSSDNMNLEDLANTLYANYLD